MMKPNLNGVHCLVLGGSGFIGSNLCRGLLASGARVRAFCRNRPAADAKAGDWQNHIEWVCGDFSDFELVARSLEGVDVAFHLISTTLPATSNLDCQADLTANVLPTLRMLEAAKTSGLRKVIYVSSGGAIYGIPQRVPIHEDHPTNPICAYGIHKLAIEKYLHLFNYLWKLEYGVLRISNPYGIDQPVNRPQGVIASFVHKVVTGEPLEIWGDGSVVRDYVDIQDVIQACLLMINHQGPSHVFNIGTGEGHSLLDLVNIIQRHKGETIPVNFRKSRPVDVPVNVLDISRAHAELKWRPTTEIAAGIQRMLEQSPARRGKSAGSILTPSK
ncbi:MAG: NAD-dependent epimerase/dehydratase family protein [Verrucomicrobiota bacterium]